MEPHSTRRLWALACPLALVWAVSGCQSEPVPEPRVAETVRPNQVGTATRGPDPVVPEVRPTQVPRPSALPADEQATAEPAAIDEVLEYSDGLAVQITRITRHTTDSRGPGEISGEPYALLEVTVINDSATVVDTSRVVATLTYGKDPVRTARPVYTDQTRDLTGNVEPGDSTEARYAFAIPDEAPGDVTLSLDIDGQHGLAMFTGAVS